MIKLFMTGDNHFGRKFDTYKEIKNQLLESRFVCLENMIHQAEKENCDLFVVTGDLFDGLAPGKKNIKRVAELLSSFNETVLVLPGNHDYYTPDGDLWKVFSEYSSGNVVLLNQFAPYELDIRDQEVVIYPAFCQSKHSKENNLGWIKNSAIDSSKINIGIAHGAIQGLTPDTNQEYFLMSEEELKSIPVDAWLIGHTHIQYPSLQEEKDVSGYKVFNAGTHEQLDLHNNTEGVGFVLTIQDDHTVLAHKYTSGKIRYYNLEVKVSSKDNLEEAISNCLKPLNKDSIVRIKVSGIANEESYKDRSNAFKKNLEGFLHYTLIDELDEEITMDMILNEYPEFSFAAKLLEKFEDQPTELQMLYEMMNECKE